MHHASDIHNFANRNTEGSVSSAYNALHNVVTHTVAACLVLTDIQLAACLSRLACGNIYKTLLPTGLVTGKQIGCLPACAFDMTLTEYGCQHACMTSTLPT